MEFNVLVMFANEWTMDDGGRGCTVNYYILNANNKFLSDLDKTGPIGQQSAKVSMPYETRSKFVAVPGVYKGWFEMTTGSDRKPTLKLVDLAYNDLIQVADCFPKSPIVEQAVKVKAKTDKEAS